jgi:hypothetical protein
MQDQLRSPQITATMVHLIATPMTV